MSWRERLLAGLSQHKIKVQRVIRLTLQRTVRSNSGAVFGKVGDELGADSKRDVAVKIFAAAHENVGAQGIRGLRLYGEMQVRGPPMLARRVRYEIAKRCVHWRGIGGRHHAPKAVMALRVAPNPPPSPHVLGVKIILNIIETAVV